MILYHCTNFLTPTLNTGFAVWGVLALNYHCRPRAKEKSCSPPLYTKEWLHALSRLVVYRVDWFRRSSMLLSRSIGHSFGRWVHG